MLSLGFVEAVGTEFEDDSVDIACRLACLRLRLSVLSDVDQVEPEQSGRGARARAQHKSET